MTTAVAEDRDRVGPYRLVKAIGAGGSARVDLACIDRAYGFQRHVVLKRPLEHLRDDPKAAASLRREARIGGLVHHPNLVGVLDAGVHAGYDFLALEYVHGASLRTLMQDDEPGRVRNLPLGAALAIVADTARGLHHAHELVDEHGAPLGLVHRDVSPGNVLVGLDGTVKLADFGIAKETRVTTLSGSMHGTVTYMAPEQCRGHAFDRRADIWALGVILYELATGARLFWADNDVASLHRVLSGTIPRPRKRHESERINPALEDIILTALAQDPGKRYATARDLADAIERHAAAIGELLTARAIAHWVTEVIGPREVPWIGSATVPEIPRVVPPEEHSLVAIIAASGDEGALDESFGPSDPPSVSATLSDPIRRKRRFVVPALITVGLSGGAIVTYVAMRTESTPLAERTPQPAEPVKAKNDEATPNVPAKTDEPAKVTDEPAKPDEQAKVDVPTSKPKKRGRNRNPIAKPDPPPPPPPIATGSNTPPGPPKPKPKWDPGLLLPTDPGSGKQK